MRDTHVSVGVKVRPAPDIPADIQQQYDALQQCLYVLRRAHSTGRADEPAKALASAGLLDMAGLQFEDPLLACKGLAPWLLYMEVLRYACSAMHAVLCMLCYACCAVRDVVQEMADACMIAMGSCELPLPAPLSPTPTPLQAQYSLPPRSHPHSPTLPNPSPLILS